MNKIFRFFVDEEAATAVEYAVLLALILVAIIGTIGALGSTTGGLWGDIDNDLQSHGLGGGP